MTVTEATATAVDIEFASNFAASGSPFEMDPVTVHDGDLLVLLAGSISSQVTDMAFTDVDGHTWTEVLPYDPAFGVLLAVWLNDTGSDVTVTPDMTATWTSNKSVGIAAYLISGSDGSPNIVATITNASTAQASATPTVVGSLLCLHYANSSPTADVSSFVSGSTADTSPAGTAVGNTGGNEFGLGTIYQTAINTQTSTPVTVGAAAPTSAESYGILVEYLPTGTGAFTGTIGAASAAGVPGTFTGSISGGFTGVVGGAAAAGVVGVFTGDTTSVPVTETTARAVAISYATNFEASGTAGSFGTYAVPDGASIVTVSGANDSNVTALDISDAAAHTWDRLIGYDPSSMPLAVDMWHNNTGATQLIDVQLAPTYTFNKTIGFAVYVIGNCGASPIVQATITGDTTTTDLSATPTADGSLLVLHYLQQQPTAVVSSFETGTTGDSTAGGYGIGNTGTDEMGLGTLYQTDPNTQTSSPVTVGAAAPSATTYAALIEYLPAASSTGQGFVGKLGHAAAAGIPGIFQGTVFVGVLAHAAAAGVPGTFEGTTVVTGPLATATAAGIPGTFAGTAFVGGGFTGVLGRAAAPGVPGVFTSGDSWTGHVGAATAHGIPGSFSNTAAPLRNITITIGPITGGWATDTPDGGWTAELPNGGWAGDAPGGGWADTGITA